MILFIPVRWQMLLGSARGGSTALSYRNCVITPGWRLMRTWYRTCFHTLGDEKNRNSISALETGDSTRSPYLLP